LILIHVPHQGAVTGWIDFSEITLAKLCVRTCCHRQSSSSSRSLPWMDGEMDEQRDEWRNGWMKKLDHHAYYISRLVGTRDLWALWSPPVSLNLVHEY
jgi:hypothetical protein